MICGYDDLAIDDVTWRRALAAKGAELSSLHVGREACLAKTPGVGTVLQPPTTATIQMNDRPVLETGSPVLDGGNWVLLKQLSALVSPSRKLPNKIADCGDRLLASRLGSHRPKPAKQVLVHELVVFGAAQVLYKSSKSLGRGYLRYSA